MAFFYVNDDLVFNEGGTSRSLTTLDSELVTAQNDITTAQGDITALEGDVSTLNGRVTTSGTNTTISSNGNGDVYIRANNVNIMRIDANGNVYFKGQGYFNQGSV